MHYQCTCISEKLDYKMNPKTWFSDALNIVFVISFFLTSFTTSRNLNNRNNQVDENYLNSDNLLANPGLLEKLTKSQLEDLLTDIEREENSAQNEEEGDANPLFLFDDIILQDLFTQSSSKEDLETLSNMLSNIPETNEAVGGNSSGTDLEEDQAQSIQSQSQNQNVSIVTNIYKQGAGGHHHHKHYHLLLLSDDGQAQGRIFLIKRNFRYLPNNLNVFINGQ